MNATRKVGRVVYFYLGAVFMLLYAGKLDAQMIERDPITVPVKIEGGLDGEKYVDEGSPENNREGSVTIRLAQGAAANGVAGTAGWNEFESTGQFVPGFEYQATFTIAWCRQVVIQFSPPPGYRVYINDVRTTRFNWSNGSVYTNSTQIVGVRVERDEVVPVGQGSSLNPGKIIWTVGMGTLTSGRSAGVISLRQLSWSRDIFTPWALSYHNSSPEAHAVMEDGILRQIYTPACLVDIDTDRYRWVRLRFFRRDTGQIGSPNSAGVCTVTGDPLFEYLIENPSYVENVAPTAIRITKTVRQWNATPTPPPPLIMWTQLTKSVAGSVTSTNLQDWVLKPSGATSVSSPIVKTWVQTPIDSTHNQEVFTTGGTAAVETRTYQTYAWGGELSKQEQGSLTTDFTYADSRLITTATTGGGWTKNEYYTDLDRSGQIYRTYKPYLDSPAAPSGAATNVGEVVTYDYEADWTGRKTLPKSIVTTVNDVETARTEYTYSTATLTDTSNTYGTAENAVMTLVVATRKEYYDGTHYLTTVTKTFRENCDIEHRFFPGLPHSEKRPDGTMSVILYFRGSFSTSTRLFTPSVGGADLMRLTLNGTNATTGTDALSTYSMGGQTQATESDFCVMPYVSTASATIVAADGTLLSSQSWIRGASDWVVVQRDVNTYADQFFLSTTTRDAGNASVTWSILTQNWINGRLDYQIDESGIQDGFNYDSVGRVQTKIRAGASGAGATLGDLTTTYGYDAAGRPNSTTIGTGTETLVSSCTYDSAGQKLTETAVGGAITSYAYDPANRKKTVTLPGLGPRVEEAYPDGKPFRLTGTGVVNEFYSYQVLSDGRRYQKVRVNSASDVRYKEVWQDRLGRTVKTSHPGFTGQSASEELSFYDDTVGNANTGRLLKTTKTGFADTLTEYNAMSQPVRSGADLDNDGALVNSSSDRIKESSTKFELVGSDWWQTSITSQYPFTEGSAATIKPVTTTRKRLTGLNSTAEPSLRAETKVTDADGNVTTIKVTVDASNKLTTTTTKRPGMAIDQVEKSLNGLPVSKLRHDGLTFTTAYDALWRKSAETDPRTATGTAPLRATTTTYWAGTSWPKEIKDAAGKRLTYLTYDTAGRESARFDAFNHTTRTSYTARGEVYRVWGSGTYPVSYLYDNYGQRTKMYTYRDSNRVFVTDSAIWPSSPGTADETEWEYDDPSGLLKKKWDAKRKFVSYTYNLRGQTATRTWARNVTTTFSYYGDGSGEPRTGELKSLSYSDSTPSVSYTYTRSGQIATVTDATTHPAEPTTDFRGFAYDSSNPWRLATETVKRFYGNRVLTHTYENSLSLDTGETAFNGHTITSVPGRPNGLKVDSTSPAAQDLRYDYATSDTGRFAGLVTKRGGSSAGETFVYGYEANSDLPKSLSVLGKAFKIERTFDGQRDLVTSVKTLWVADTPSTILTEFDYAYDDRRQRQSVVQSGTALGGYYATDDAIHQIFSYNGRGELTAAATYLGSNPASQEIPLSARRHDFDYDGIGNRRSSNTSGEPGLRDDYAVNELNQYISRENNTLAVDGVAEPESSGTKIAVGVEAMALAGRAGRHWGDNIVVNNFDSVAGVARPFYGNLKVFAVKAGAGTGGKDLLQTETKLGFLPPAAQTFTYDEDGNITFDCVWNYLWDAENRLVRMGASEGAVAAGMPNIEINFQYDYLGRRVQKRVQNQVAPGAELSCRRYLYDGWSLIAEFDAPGGDYLSTLTLVRSFTWGLDIAKSLTDAGGVGALVRIHDYSSNKDYLPAYDGNGNVVALFDADASSSSNACVAAYEYSPFGELLRASGAYAKINSFRFSTKYQDDETGLVYYGRRYYDVKQGRFVGRDPIEEKGGIHLYGFVTNNPVNAWDYLGMEVQYVDGNGSSFSDMNIGKGTLASKLAVMSTPTEGNNAPSEDDAAQANQVVGVVRIIQDDGSVREIPVTKGMASSTASISSLSSMGTVTSFSNNWAGSAIMMAPVRADPNVPNSAGNTNSIDRASGLQTDAFGRPVLPSVTDNPGGSINVVGGRQGTTAEVNAAAVQTLAAGATVTGVVLVAPAAGATITAAARPIWVAAQVATIAYGSRVGDAATSALRYVQYSWYRAQNVITQIVTNPSQLPSGGPPPPPPPPLPPPPPPPYPYPYPMPRG